MKNPGDNPGVSFVVGEANSGERGTLHQSFIEWLGARLERMKKATILFI
jgi:hypothetical protein